MAKTYFIPGFGANGKRNVPLGPHPGAEQYYKNRKETSHDASGLTAGEEVMFRGDPAKVLYEEKNQHTGEIETYVQRSKQGDAGIYRVTWAPDHDRSIAIRDVRRSF